MKKKILALALAMVMLFSIGMVALATDSTAADDSATGDSSGALEIYVARHGETLFNTRGVVQGWCDSPLTENGVASSGYVGAGLKDAGIVFDAAYTSDMTRCIETAGYMLAAMQSELSPTWDKRFREMNFGTMEGDATSALREAYPDIYKYETFAGFEGGEDWNDFFGRLTEGLNEIGAAHAGTDEKVLVTAHGMVQVALMFMLTEDFVPSSDAVPNNGVMVLEYLDGEITLKSAPTTSYLDKGMELAGVEPVESDH